MSFSTFERSVQEAPALPDTFEIVEARPLKDWNGTGFLIRHKRTGMDVFLLRCPDRELFCGYLFRTPSSSSDGAAHILEHTVLSGSRKFPLRDPFNAVCKGSAASFINAMTFSGSTFYPFASVVEKDFSNIFKVYTDAVFDPLLRKESFLLEGVRQEGEAFDGVVFNEMKGAYSDIGSILSFLCRSALFKGTELEFESGGLALEIPGLTYERYLEAYRRWYHPSNCLLFLYGNLDAGRYLEYLDENYLRFRAPAEPQPPYPADIPLAAPFALEVPGPDSEKAQVVVSWATGSEADPLELETLSVLVDILLGDPGSPLHRAITESPLGDDLNEESGMEGGMGLMPFTVGFSGARREDARKIEAFILDTLGGICAKGLDPRLVEASLKGEEFDLRESARKEIPLGFLAAQRAMRGRLSGRSIFDSVETSRPLELLRARLREDPRHFEHWIEKNLIGNPRRLLLTVYPDPDYETRLQKALSSKLRPQTPAETAALDSALERFQKAPEPEFPLSLGREDLGGALPPLFCARTMAAGREVLAQSFPSNGICYYALGFDASDLSEDEMLLLPLLLRLVWMTDVGEMDYTEAGVRLRELTGGAYAEPLSSMARGGAFVSSAVVMAKTLREDSLQALPYLARVLLESKVGDEERIAAAVAEMASEFKADFAYSANRYGTRRAAAAFSPACLARELTGGLSGEGFLQSLRDAPVGQTARRLLDLRAKLFCQARLRCQTGSADEDLAQALAALEAFAGSLPPGEPAAGAPLAGRGAGEGPEEELFSLPGTVAYNCLAVRLPAGSERDRAAGTLLGFLLTETELWRRIRVEGGAYGASGRAAADDGVFLLSSYRDPRIKATRDAFAEALRALASGAATSAMVENAAVSLAGRELRPLSPMDLFTEGRRRFLLGWTEELRNERLRLLLDLGPEDVSRLAAIVLEEMEKGRTRAVTIAPAGLLRREGLGDAPARMIRL